jgi:membrane-bound ClpP family serine protease
MMEPLTWAMLLLAAGLILVVVEFFVPSSGVLGVSALVCLVAANVLAFRHSGSMGLLFMACAVLGVPVLLALGANLWPHTPIGQRVLLRVPLAKDVLPDSPRRRELKQLVGKIGQAKSLMMPSGAVEIAGHTIDATSEGQPIESGATVKVIEVRGMHVVVRVVTADEANKPLAQAPARGGVLEQPLDSLGLNDLNEPLN